MKRNSLKTMFTILYISVFSAAGIIRLTGDDTIGGIVFLSTGCLIILIKLISNRKREKTASQKGLVLFDERDLESAGKAALLTLRIQLAVTGLFVLVLYAFNIQQNMPVIVLLCLLMALSVLILQISYRVYNKPGE